MKQSPGARRSGTRTIQQMAEPMILVDGNEEKEGIAEVLAMLAARAHRTGEPIAIASRLGSHFRRAGIVAGELLRIFDSAADALRQVKDAKRPGVVICLGGDGALLHIVREHHALGLPFIGVNLGSVGFNASVSPEALEKTLDDFEKGKAHIAERFALWARHLRNGEQLGESIAVNDVVVQREPSSRMLEVRLHQGGHAILAYHADGLVLATPTGSTAYNLSTGGPVLEPALRAVAITGIAPHTLTSRPIVLTPDPPLILTAYCKRDAHQGLIIVDGQEIWPLKHGDRVEISAYPQPIRIVNPQNYDYFETLRKKLGWSVPIRPLGT
jgi:NAD+ kinase